MAYWADWRFWGLDKEQWGDLHLNLGLLLLLAGGLHLSYNWSAITAYLKNRARRLTIFTADFTIALILTLVIGLGTYFALPPFSWVIDLSTSLKDAAAVRYGEPPYGHAELSTLKSFAQTRRLDLEQSLLLLKRARIRVDSAEQTLKEIARANNLAPQEVYLVIKEAAVEPAPEAAPNAAVGGLPSTPPPGIGRKTLAELSAAYRVDLDRMLEALAARGIKASPEMRIKEIASANGMEGMAVYAIIQEATAAPRPTAGSPSGGCNGTRCGVRCGSRPSS